VSAGWIAVVRELCLLSTVVVVITDRTEAKLIIKVSRFSERHTTGIDVVFHKNTFLTVNLAFLGRFL